MSAPTVTLSAPANAGTRLFGLDGIEYPIVAGAVTLPPDAVAPGLFGKGFALTSGCAGYTAVADFSRRAFMRTERAIY